MFDAVRLDHVRFPVDDPSASICPPVPQPPAAETCLRYRNPTLGCDDGAMLPEVLAEEQSNLVQES